MSKYRFTSHDRIKLVVRMYQDHGFTMAEICNRLRYTETFVEAIIKKYNLKNGEKSWRY